MHKTFSLITFWTGFRNFWRSASDPPYDWPCGDAFFSYESFFSGMFWTSLNAFSFAINETPVVDPAIPVKIKDN